MDHQGVHEFTDDSGNILYVTVTSNPDGIFFDIDRSGNTGIEFALEDPEDLYKDARKATGEPSVSTHGSRIAVKLWRSNNRSGNVGTMIRALEFICADLKKRAGA